MLFYLHSHIPYGFEEKITEKNSQFDFNSITELNSLKLT
jgi:hypothetical protein